MNTNKPETKKLPQDVFDDNFEVIYEGELPELPNDLGNDDYKDVLSNLSDLDTTNSLGIDYLEQNRTRTFTSMPNSRAHHRPAKKRSAASFILQAATLLLIVSIAGFLAAAFWNHNASYTSAVAAIPGHNYILGSYYGISLFLLLIEWIAFLNVLLNTRTSRGGGVLSFLSIYLGSLLSHLFAGRLPSSPVYMLGIREALTVYGSLQSILLLLCSAGIATCIIRRFYNGRQ